MSTSNGGESGTTGWTFLTSHSQILICIDEDTSARSRDIAVRVGITERAVHRIVTELCDAGYVTKVREGRRNRYTLQVDGPLRHPLAAHCTVAELLGTVRHSTGDGNVAAVRRP